ncbi:hypothetical protein HOY82DRAFT_120013 [Tuber indicum]|nr:hypothetical protein HOY82DRAFT_120013 [Tuber indicum]
MDILGKHRIGFNNLGVQLFADLERDLSLALTKGSSEKVDLERVIVEQKELLQERQALIDAYEDTSEQQQQKIREQESRLQNLGYERAKAKIENEALAERLEGIEKADRGHQCRALAITNDKSIHNPSQWQLSRLQELNITSSNILFQELVQGLTKLLRRGFSLPGLGPLNNLRENRVKFL